MTRISIALEPTREPHTFRLVVNYRCDSCGWETTTARMNSRGHPMRLRPRRPVSNPDVGPIEHECESCAVARLAR